MRKHLAGTAAICGKLQQPGSHHCIRFTVGQAEIRTDEEELENTLSKLPYLSIGEHLRFSQVLHSGACGRSVANRFDNDNLYISSSGVVGIFQRQLAMKVGKYRPKTQGGLPCRPPSFIVWSKLSKWQVNSLLILATLNLDGV